MAINGDGVERLAHRPPPPIPGGGLPAWYEEPPVLVSLVTGTVAVLRNLALRLRGGEMRAALNIAVAQFLVWSLLSYVTSPRLPASPAPVTR